MTKILNFVLNKITRDIKNFSSFFYIKWLEEYQRLLMLSLFFDNL